MDRIIGAFVFPDTWQAWSEPQAHTFLESLAAMGVNALCTESETYRRDLIELAHRLGMKWIGGISCFSDHAHNHQLLKDRPELWPVGEDGQLRPPMEWYLGVTPTFEEYNLSRLQLVEDLARNYELDGLVLDFIRWPVHWELELRPGALPPLQYSFDPHTLRLFVDQAAITLPERFTTREKAAWILANFWKEWVDFKCGVVTRFVEQAAARLRPLRPPTFSLGLYSLPMPPGDLESIAGQRIRDLAPLVDFVAPMVYHAIVHRDASWAKEIVTSTANEANVTGCRVLPVLQVDSAEGAEMGADWGPPISPQEWSSLLHGILHLPSVSGIVAFTGTSLFRDGRGSILASI